MKKRFRKRLKQLEWGQRENIKLISGFLAFFVFLALFGYGVYRAQGPEAHSEIVALHREYKDRTGVVVARSPILSGDWGDHRVLTVRYQNVRGGMSFWEYPASYRIPVGTHLHLVISRQTVVWTRSDMELWGRDNPLKPAQGQEIVSHFAATGLLMIIPCILLYNLMVISMVMILTRERRITSARAVTS